jgi:hypothetical protein
MSTPRNPQVRRGFSAKLRAIFAGAAVTIVGFAIAVGCGENNALVGGRCVAERTLCGDFCVDLSNDAEHCGRCDNVCAPGVPCVDGVCGGGDATTDGSTDGATDGNDDGADGRVRDVNTPDEGVDDGSTSDGNVTDGNPTDGNVSDGNISDASTEAGDAETCTPPEVLCPSGCTDLDTDPLNCGRCGNFCPSLLCVGGVCQGALTGDIVVIGHDYFAGVSGSAQARVLTNAVFLSRSNPLRVWSFTRWARPQAVSRVVSIIASAATQLGRGVQQTSIVDETQVTTNLNKTNTDVLLVHDQALAPAGAAAALGTTWRNVLDGFLRGGGTVIVLDGNGAAESSQVGQMPAFSQNAGLLDIATRTDLAPNSRAFVSAPADAIGIGVVSPYAAALRSVTITTPESGPSVVPVIRAESNNEPIVIHKTVP